MTATRTAFVLLLLGTGPATAQANTPADGTAPRPGRWDFAVTLDDRPIGRHRFELAGDPASGEWTVKSQADYDVKLLGLSVYTYRHSATERWRAGCLAQLDARTDDNGDVTSVQAAPTVPPTTDAEPAAPWRIAVRSEDRAITAAAAAPQDARGCLMTYAYWNAAALRQQARLLNPQTGRLDAIQGSPLAAAPVTVAGQTVQAQGWRIRTPKGPVDIWTAPDGRWIGLDATVSGDRRLRYRLP
ncbi:MAG TPA: DUF6134 family protein [Burkholderiaceae bacterium]|nr:DUF6134 family protein [Burkholderiaceae bacterium]HNG79073.1 DUF6134 family protein [Burkholderiaceae bacterium]